MKLKIDNLQDLKNIKSFVRKVQRSMGVKDTNVLDYVVSDISIIIMNGKMPNSRGSCIKTVKNMTIDHIRSSYKEEKILVPKYKNSDLNLKNDESFDSTTQNVLDNEFQDFYETLNSRDRLGFEFLTGQSTQKEISKREGMSNYSVRSCVTRFKKKALEYYGENCFG